MEVGEHVTANWFTPEGLRLKRMEIERKGLPDMHNYRFSTLTIDMGLFGDDPLEAYFAGRARLRRFTQKLRDRFFPRHGEGGEDDMKFCWWFQFHKNGNPHWHMCWSYKRRLTKDDFVYIESAWGIGSTNTQRINERDAGEGNRFGYFFTYPFKAPYDGDSGKVVPDWFAEYHGFKTVTADGVEFQKPETFDRARFWQTSKGFYVHPREVKGEVKEPET
jgi:hypothetical protein